MIPKTVNEPPINCTVGVLLPTYCEGSNIKKIVDHIESLPLNSEILIVDDSSPDGTSEIVYSLQKKYSNISLIVRDKKYGLGTAITAGFRFFLSKKVVPEFIVTMDADNSHDPDDLPRLVSNTISGYDLVIGSRYCEGGLAIGWSYLRKVISRSANMLARFKLGLKPVDCTSGFRCYSSIFLSKTIGCFHSHTYEIQIETIKQAQNQGFSVKEIPITFRNRKSGKSKLTMNEIKSFFSYVFK